MSKSLHIFFQAPSSIAEDRSDRFSADGRGLGEAAPGYATHQVEPREVIWVAVSNQGSIGSTLNLTKSTA